ncbi:MAG: MarR family transcriptional regulator [Cyanobacteria bacterium P01_F01_bin.53]
MFRPLEITSGQYSLLVALARPNPPSIGQLAQAMGMDRTTITANIKPLKRRGLVDIVPAPSDARSRLLTLTLEGKTLLQRALPLWQTAQDQMLEGLSAEGGEGEQLLMMLRQVAD